MTTLLQKLKKRSVVERVEVMDKSTLFNTAEQATTDVLGINIALSGSVDGGLPSGLTILAGPSKHFKTLFGLIMAKAYMDKYPDSIMIFYDSEFGATKEYFETVGIDITRVLHVPVSNIEELKQDVAKKFVEKSEDSVNYGDKVIIFFDSIGNIASKKEIDDAISQNTAADMTRAKQLKSFFRILTPRLTVLNIPMIAINHVYASMGMFPVNVMGGGCLAKDTKIHLSNGNLIEIQNVKFEDEVMTLLGPRKVLNAWKPGDLEENDSLIEIEFEDGYKIICTENHKFLVEDTWVEAKNLHVNMNVEELTKN